jgi:hypothetical protein
MAHRFALLMPRDERLASRWVSFTLLH